MLRAMDQPAPEWLDKLLLGQRGIMEQLREVTTVLKRVDARLDMVELAVRANSADLRDLKAKVDSLEKSRA